MMISLESTIVPDSFVRVIVIVLGIVDAIDRSEFAESIEKNNERVIANPNDYRQRQQLAEHPFGTLKRQRGFTFTLMKGKEKVLGEVGLEFIGYNPDVRRDRL